MEVARGDAALLPDEGDVDLASSQRGDLLAGGKIEQLDLHLGMDTPQRRERRIQKSLRGGGEVADAQLLLLSAREPARFRDGCIVFREKPAGSLRKGMAGIGEADTGRGTFQESPSNLIFQRLHLA